MKHTSLRLRRLLIDDVAAIAIGIEALWRNAMPLLLPVLVLRGRWDPTLADVAACRPDDVARGDGVDSFDDVGAARLSSDCAMRMLSTERFGTPPVDATSVFIALLRTRPVVELLVISLDNCCCCRWSFVNKASLERDAAVVDSMFTLSTERWPNLACDDVAAVESVLTLSTEWWPNRGWSWLVALVVALVVVVDRRGTLVLCIDKLSQTQKWFRFGVITSLSLSLITQSC